ncbi:hypothetical protein B0H11DRAFT_2191942 [Mycena galericulata]|nr:hypothetical protein B0H11DRAFT_2191942 [Mycena galericulata]
MWEFKIRHVGRNGWQEEKKHLAEEAQMGSTEGLMSGTWAEKVLRQARMDEIFGSRCRKAIITQGARANLEMKISQHRRWEAERGSGTRSGERRRGEKGRMKGDDAGRAGGQRFMVGQRRTVGAREESIREEWEWDSPTSTNGGPVPLSGADGSGTGDQYLPLFVGTPELAQTYRHWLSETGEKIWSMSEETHNLKLHTIPAPRKNPGAGDTRAGQAYYSDKQIFLVQY